MAVAKIATDREGYNSSNYVGDGLPCHGMKNSSDDEEGSSDTDDKVEICSWLRTILKSYKRSIGEQKAQKDNKGTSVYRYART